MEYSIIIPFYDNQRLLDLCLRNLFATIDEAECEVLVIIDNPQQEGLRPSTHGPVRLVRPGVNLGYSGACNLGAWEARGQTLVFLDSDIVPEAGWLPALAARHRSGRSIGGVAGKLLDLSRGRMAYFGLAFHEVDVMKPFQHNRADLPFVCADRSFQSVPSGLFMISRKVFGEIDGFDEQLFNAYSDLDFSLKLQQAGLQTWVAAGALGYHRGGVSGEIRHSMHSDVKALFFRKWGGVIRNDALEILQGSARAFAANRTFRGREVLAVNLSSTLFHRDYMESIMSALPLQPVTTYNLPGRDRTLQSIRLEERLSWDVCRTRIPIFYFLDDFSQVEHNHYWFMHRAHPGDIVADRHGNIFSVEEMAALS
ncbi:MAG TPA: glycosyltransferase family 2 protein [Longimicrobium sp.]